MKDIFNNAVGPQIREKHKKGLSIIPVFSVLFLFSGFQAATQYFANSFNYQEALGSHFYNFYLPWSIIDWGVKWSDQYTLEFQQAVSFGMVVSSLGLLILYLIKVFNKNSSKLNPYLHGSARWANLSDIRHSGLLPQKRSLKDKLLGNGQEGNLGVYVGAWKDRFGKLHYLRHNGPENVLNYAPTRSGKGVGLVIPTLLSWPHSAVITDLKGELWALTSGWRKEYAKNKVMRFEPAAANGSVKWNPLDEIRLTPETEVGDVQNIATLIVDPDGKGLQSHWQKTSQALLVGVILHILYKSKNEGSRATLSAVDAALSNPDRDVAELWMEMITYEHSNQKVHPVVAASARDMMDRPEEEAGSVLSTAKSYLSLYRDPIVAHNTSMSEFKIRDLMHHHSPVSLYIVTQPRDKVRLRPLVRVMLNMVVRLLTDDIDFERVESKTNTARKLLGKAFSKRRTEVKVQPKNTYKHRLLGMIDEFPSLGKLEILQEALAYCAGYGIKFYLICQDLNQLKSREIGYGPDETITSNCHVQNAYPPNRLETAEHLSKLTGQTTIVKEQVTTSGKRMSTVLGGVSRTTQEVARPLLTADECMRMPGPKKDATGNIKSAGDMVIYVAGFPAIYGCQPLYFKDDIFLARAAVPQPESSDKIIEHSMKDEEPVSA